MRTSLPLLLSASVFFLMADALAGPRDYLFRDERICDTDEVFCLRGMLSYDSNPRLLHLRARVQKAPGPGLLRIMLEGSNRQGHRHIVSVEVRVRGHYSEIIDHKMIPDYPDTQSWAVFGVVFAADKTL